MVINADSSSELYALALDFNPPRAGIPPYKLAVVLPVFSTVINETLVSIRCATQNVSDFILVNQTISLNGTIVVLNVTIPGFFLNQTSQQTLCNLNGLNVNY